MISQQDIVRHFDKQGVYYNYETFAWGRTVGVKAGGKNLYFNIMDEKKRSLRKIKRFLKKHGRN